MEDKDYMKNFVHGMEIAIAIKGITKHELTQNADVNPSFLARLNDARKSSNPRLSTLMKITAALDMSIEEVVALPDKAKGLIDAKN
jgi:predicted transcriptional regulator